MVQLMHLDQSTVMHCMVNVELKMIEMIMHQTIIDPREWVCMMNLRILLVGRVLLEQLYHGMI